MADHRNKCKVDIKEEFLTCSICMEPFTRPKILPCVHTFCCQCLKIYITSVATSKKRGGFPCPTCRQFVPIKKNTKAPETWPDQLKDNFVMTSMLEALNRQNSVSETSPVSISTPANPDTQSTDGACAAENARCTCHRAQDNVCWCCGVFVCDYCALDKHSTCSQVKRVSLAGPEKRQEMLNWLSLLNKNLTHLQKRQSNAQSSIISLQDRHDALQMQITQATRDAIQIIRMQEHKLRETMERKFEAMSQHDKKCLHAASTNIETLTSLKDAMERAVVEEDTELLRQAHCLQQRYTDLVDRGVMTAEREDDETIGQDLDAGCFKPASLTDLQSLDLVGVYQGHGVGEPGVRRLSSVTPPSFPASDNKSCCLLPEGPVIRPRLRCHSEPFASTSLLSDLKVRFDGPLNMSPVAAAQDSSTGASTDEDTPLSLSSPLLLSGTRAVTCKHTHSFYAKHKGDKVQPLIRDFTVLTNGWIIAIDAANRCVKCFYKDRPEDGKHQCKRLVLTQQPYGIGHVEGCVVVVTVPKEHQLQMVLARPHLVPLSTISLSPALQEPLWAVSSLGEQRLVVTTSPQGGVGSVLILQMSGETAQCVKRYNSPVKTPLYTATNGNNLILSDPTSCHVAGVSTESGQLIFEFHTQGKTMGVACHHEATLVVDQSPALRVLTSEGRCVHSIPLPKGKAGCSHPRAVVVAPDSTIYVSDDEGRIHMFHLRWRDHSVSS